MKAQSAKFSSTLLRHSIRYGLFFLSILLSVWLLFWIGERYFFDKLFYKRSALHGYFSLNNSGLSQEETGWLNTTITNLREADLQRLKSGAVWPPQQKNKIRIAIIGDSNAYGVGVLPWERYSKLLPKELKKHSIESEVFTFAEPGNSIVDYYALYTLIKQQVNPDIIINLVVNDLLFNPDRYSSSEVVLQDLDEHCSKLPLYTGSEDREKNYTEAMYKSYSPHYRNRCYLEVVAKELSKDTTVAYFSMSSSYDLPKCGEESQVDDVVFMTDYESVMSGLGVSGQRYIFDLPDDKAHVTETENHPSRYTHQAYARQLSAYIASHFYGKTAARQQEKQP